jgi:hypothetical protein
MKEAQEIGRRMAENRAPVSPPPDVTRLSPARLGAALRALPYRPSAFLLARLVQRRSLEECASLYGISPEAFSVHLLRAGQSLAAEVELPHRPPVNEAEEALWARHLSEALEREAVAGPSSLASTVELCRRLREQGPEVRTVLEVAEREEEDSPKRRREDQVRRLLILGLVGLTAWLYCTRPAEELELPTRPPVPIER